jgi:type IV pilus assembly protein PilA
MKKEMNGFTLIQVLLTLAILIVGAFLVYFVVVRPTFARMELTSNEELAINGMEEISTAEMQYESTFPEKGFACSLGDLQQIGLSAQLVNGERGGYRFAISNCTTANLGGALRNTGFRATAVPGVLRKTGNRGFCVGTDGKVKVDPSGGSNCTQELVPTQ